MWVSEGRKIILVFKDWIPAAEGKYLIKESPIVLWKLIKQNVWEVLEAPAIRQYKQ